MDTTALSIFGMFIGFGVSAGILGYALVKNFKVNDGKHRMLWQLVIFFLFVAILSVVANIWLTSS